MSFSLPWRNWYHCMANTYGTWLPGDKRGFRTRHHREHVEGDYKNPPAAGEHVERRRRSEELMGRDAVLLSWEARVCACQEIVSTMLFHGVDVVECAVTQKHLHLLARFTPWPGEAMEMEERRVVRSPRIAIRGLPSAASGREARQARPPRHGPARQSALDDPPRHFVGIGKKRSARALAKAELVAEGGVWAKRGKVVPIENEGHFERVATYIREHVEEGAAVYSLLPPE